MSSNTIFSEEQGADSEASGVDTLSTTSSDSGQPALENMKRAAAKQLFERYYYQLKDGCGYSECSNEFCASNRQARRLSPSEAAAKAIELSKNKAHLCSVPPTKVAKAGGISQKDSPELQRKSAPDVRLCGTSGGQSNQAGSSTSTGTGRPCSVGCSGSSSNSGKVEKSSAKLEYLTEQKLHDIIMSCRETGVWSRLIHTIGAVYSDPELLMNSFLVRHRPKVTSATLQLSKEDIRAMEVDLDKDHDEQESKDDEHVADDVSIDSDSDSVDLSSIAVVEPAAKTRLSPGCSSVDVQEDENSVDLESLRRAYDELFSLPDLPFEPALINAVLYLSRNVSYGLRYNNELARSPCYLNMFVIIAEIPTLDSLEFLEQATPQFCRTLGMLPVSRQAQLTRIWSRISADRLRAMVLRMQQLITVRIISNHWSRTSIINDDEGITGAARVVKMLYYASLLGGRADPPDVIEAERQMNEEASDNMAELMAVGGAVGGFDLNKERQPQREDPLARTLHIRPIDVREPLVASSEFVNESLSEQLEMDKDYTYYKADVVEKFTFMLHPFLLTTAVKNMGMYFDNRIRMMSERRASMLHTLMHGEINTPYLRLRIRRDHVVDDALVNLEMVMDSPQDLRKQLYVEFEGEQGIDEGGVSKEFFQLVIEELFNPDIGMFTFDEETRCFWFNPTSFENDAQFTLIGILLGLAIYNNVILDIHFPMVVYRKLAGKLGTFEDLKLSHPTLASSLQQMLVYDGDVAETFMQPFFIGTTDVFGNQQTHNLKENGEQIIVTNETRKEFVDLYANFLLNKSVEKQFRAFKRGFQMVTDESPLQMLFYPEEIEMLVCGSRHFGFQALEEAADYDGGFTAESTTIKHFWEVVHEFGDEQKRQLLQFATGSDRVPIGGLAKLKLIIARNGPDSDRLPTSHTCFNVLLLPDYANKDKLRERLLKAITYSKGFGML